jgi:hypothetical protein
MDLEVVGRHAMLFDDDGMAAFVNSPEALVDWNSLSIDRYDVRHLLSGPIPPRLKRRHHPSPSIEADLDHQRYLDLPSSPPHEQSQGNLISLLLASYIFYIWFIRFYFMFNFSFIWLQLFILDRICCFELIEIIFSNLVYVF